MVTMLLFLAGFVLAGMTLICVNITEYDRIEYNKRCDITRTGCMLNDNVGGFEPDTSGITDYEKKIDMLLREQPFQRFYNRLKKSGLVEKCAQYSILGNPEVDEDIVRFQQGHQINNYAKSDCVEVTHVQKDLFDLYDIKVESKVDRDDWCTDGIILGYRFKEKYEDIEYINFLGKKCKLLGFLKENQKLSFEEVAHKDGIALTGLYNLDYAFFHLYPEDAYTGVELHFRLAQGVTREEFRKKAKEMAKEEEATIETLYFMDEHLSELKKGNIDILGYINEFAVGLLLGVTLICIFFKVHSILRNKKIYGIFYSSGLSTHQINALFVIENVIILFISLIMAYLCLYHGIFYFCEFFGSVPHLIVDVVKSVLVSKVFVQEFLLCCAMIIVTSGIPILLFSRLSPLSMMRDFYE